jgi:hypothetical protein
MGRHNRNKITDEMSASFLPNRFLLYMLRAVDKKSNAKKSTIQKITTATITCPSLLGDG